MTIDRLTEKLNRRKNFMHDTALFLDATKTFAETAPTLGTKRFFRDVLEDGQQILSELNEDIWYLERKLKEAQHETTD